MQNEAIFDNIAERIQQEINKAQKSIFVAVAWFTNKTIFDALVHKSRKGCTVSVIISDDHINLNSSIDYEALVHNSSKVYKIGNGDTKLMHNKFCVIDYTTVITESYNWSYRAESNFENVTITSNDTMLAGQFINQFHSIRKRYYPDVVKESIDFPLHKIVIRLEILKSYISLGDVEELSKETSKLTPYDFNADLMDIIHAVKQGKFTAALNKIQFFISIHQQLSSSTDLELAALTLDSKNVENQLIAYNNEKIEMEKLLAAFQHRHVMELGGTILDIFNTRKLRFKETDNDVRYYKEQVATERSKKVFILTDKQKTELKNKFRQAIMLCHPIKVSEKYKGSAQNIYTQLRQAYNNNDLAKVNELLYELEKGNLLTTNSEKVVEKNALKVAIGTLQKQIKTLESDIIAIKESDTFKTISSLGDWDSYFSSIKKELKEELSAATKDDLLF